MWVAGEIHRLRASRRGHLYFELVEKGEGDEIVGKLEAVCWRSDLRSVRRTLAASGLDLAEEQQIRCRGGLDFYPPFGRLQLVVREVDPVFTLGDLARRRRQTLEALAADGLLELNRSRPLPRLPLDLALVTSEGSAAYHDFLSTLRESGYGFRVRLLHAAVQGRDAERELAAALAGVAKLSVDCAVLIRGGGSRTDLAAFDSRPVAEAVARAPVPVLAGLGHEIDETIADRVAHTALKTPTKVADFLVERVRGTDRAVAELDARLRRGAVEPLERARQAVAGAERAARLAGLRLAGARQRLALAGALVGRAGRGALAASGREVAAAAARLRATAPRRLAAERRARRERALRITAAAGSRLREVAARLDGHARLCRSLSPRRTLARGFTLTRGAGREVVRSSRGLEPGHLLWTEWIDGRAASRVEER